MITSRHTRRLLRWASVIAWLGWIYYWSSVPDLRSGFDATWDLILRKIAHGIEYAILCGVWFWAWRGEGVSKRRAILWAIGCSIVAAGFDEWHQSFVVGRHGQLSDVAIDSLGIIGYAGWAVRSQSKSS